MKSAVLSGILNEILEAAKYLLELHEQCEEFAKHMKSFEIDKVNKETQHADNEHNDSQNVGVEQQNNQKADSESESDVEVYHEKFEEKQIKKMHRHQEDLSVTPPKINQQTNKKPATEKSGLPTEYQSFSDVEKKKRNEKQKKKKRTKKNIQLPFMYTDSLREERLIKRCFIAISLKCHPDKLQSKDNKAEMISDFTNAKEAKERNDLGILLAIGHKHRVVKFLETIDMPILKKSLYTLVQQIQALKGSTVYQYMQQNM